MEKKKTETGTTGEGRMSKIHLGGGETGTARGVFGN